MYAAIWDMDGTLVDTAEQHFLAWQQICQELGREFTRADFASTFGRRNPEIMSQLFPGQFSQDQENQLADRKEALYRDLARKGVTLLPGVADLLEGLHQAGFRQGVGSSAPRANLDMILEITGIARYLSAIVASEDTTRGKPDPQVFLTAAKKLHVEPHRAIVFEDAVAGVQAAHAGGMRCVGVTFVGHHSAEKLHEAGADLVVASLAEVRVEDVRHLLGMRAKENP